MIGVVLMLAGFLAVMSALALYANRCGVLITKKDDVWRQPEPRRVVPHSWADGK